MVTETTNVKPLLRFLCERLYLSVPHELFDRYLWLYHDLEEVQHKTVYGGRSDQPRFVVAQTRGTVTGVAAILDNGSTLVTKAHAVDGEALADLVAHLATIRDRHELHLTFADEAMASAAAKSLGTVVERGTTKYYGQRPCGQSKLPVREMEACDEPYLAGVTPRRWPAYRQFLELGTRFFGLVLDGRLKAMCGLSQLTGLQTQIIGVETFDMADRQKGYGKAVSALALHEGLRDAPIVTWSTSLGNVASCRTAESLGMRPYYALYQVGRKG